MDYCCTVEKQQDWRQRGIFYVKRKKYDLATKQKVLYETDYLVLNMRKVRMIGAFFVRICLVGLLLLAVILLTFKLLASGNDKMLDGRKQEKNLRTGIYNIEKETREDQMQTYDTDETFIQRCSTERLAREEIYQQAQGHVEILQYYINYLYALHGQAFEEGGEVDRTFRGKEWYRQMEGELREVQYEDLNFNEQHNVDIMVEVLEMEGYR